jgi:transcriptional regulator with XRE-family HTH domain
MRGLEIVEKHLGLAELCRRLGTTAPTIEAWRLARTEMPDPEFLKLVDLLSDLEPGWMSPGQKR